MKNVYDIKAINPINNLINLLLEACPIIEKISQYTTIKYTFIIDIFSQIEDTRIITC